MKKVYCGQCKYFVKNYHPTEGFVIGSFCKKLSKEFSNFEESWTRDFSPKNKNKKNNCKDFEKNFFNKLKSIFK